jgi:hypothetical protein
MRSLKMVLGFAVVACVLFAVSAASAVAAPKFASSKAGGELVGKALNTQVFKTVAVSVECKKLEITKGSAKTVTEAASQKAGVKYTECKTLGAKTTVTEAKYNLFANGEVKVENTITITPEGIGCHLTVKPQQVKGVTYKNVGKNVELTAKVPKVKYESSGGLCGASGEAEYTGKSLVEQPGATIEWEASS